jgi:hypothetical protein
MFIAVFHLLAASKAEPLATMLDRVHAAFRNAGLGSTSVTFTLADHARIANLAVLREVPGFKRVSAIERVLKRMPSMEPFVRSAAARDGEAPAIQALTNLGPGGSVEPVDFALLMEIAKGVPKSFPFAKALFHFAAPGFSEGPASSPVQDARTLAALMRAGVDIGAGHPTSPGLSIQDSWWVNGRERNMAALRVIEADPTAKKLPAPPPAVAALLAACGKIRKTMQLPVVVPDAARVEHIDTRDSEIGRVIRAVVRAWRARIPDLLEKLPHDLDPVGDASSELPGMSPSGPKKPVLERAFSGMGYDCKGGTGTFVLRRRTTGNLTVELKLDVGTWNNALMAFFFVQGLIDGQGFKATLNLPVARRAPRGIVGAAEVAGQFPIGGPERWSQIVENLSALVTALDDGFVPEIEAAAGPSPQWYQSDNGPA